MDDGLIIVEINQPVESLKGMRRMVESQRLKHPVLWDEDRRNTKAYGVCDWPFAYLIGADGKVFWEGDPTRWIRREKKIKEMRAMVEWELAWAKKLNAETDQRLLGLLRLPDLLRYQALGCLRRLRTLVRTGLFYSLDLPGTLDCRRFLIWFPSFQSQRDAPTIAQGGAS